MSTETLAILGALTGIVGALTGVASLIWQIVTHRRSGRLVSVVSSYVIPVYGPPHSPEFLDDDQVAVTVSNRGGAPVTVLNYGVSMGRPGKGTNMFVVNRDALTTPLPAVVEPGGEPVQVTIPVKQLRQAGQERGVPFRKMRPWVDLGDGRRIYSKRTVPLK
jgi:hypothetical protein